MSEDSERVVESWEQMTIGDRGPRQLILSCVWIPDIERGSVNAQECEPYTNILHYARSVAGLRRDRMEYIMAREVTRWAKDNGVLWDNPDPFPDRPT